MTRMEATCIRTKGGESMVFDVAVASSNGRNAGPHAVSQSAQPYAGYEAGTSFSSGDTPPARRSLAANVSSATPAGARAPNAGFAGDAHAC